MTQTQAELREIFHLVQRAGGVDLTCYKAATIHRRIARRMQMHSVRNLSEYLQILRQDNNEVEKLAEEVLITYTRFFRDDEAFEALQKDIIPEIYRQLPKYTIARVWVPGCASGQEAYSIAICFVEAGFGRTWPPVQIFATDASDHCITRARQAQYRELETAGLSAQRRNQFFVKSKTGWTIARQIRNLCVFARQDLIKDPPLAHMDLVSCRNVLMYLDVPTQEHVLHRLHYALKPGGFLFLGTSETVLSAPGLFEQAHSTQHLFFKLSPSKPANFARRPKTREPMLSH